MRKGYNGVKFYSSTGWCSPQHLKKVESILNAFVPGKESMTINQILELYNIKRYFDIDVCLQSWMADTQMKYKQIVSMFEREFGIFFSHIDSSNIEEYATSVDFDYADDFWSQIARYKVYKRINSDSFVRILRLNSTYFRHILQNKSLIEYYNNSIAEYMCKTPRTAKYLISYYLVKHDHECAQMYFPKALTSEAKSSLIESYIASSDINQNELELISKAQSSDDLPLTDKMIFAAKKKYNSLVDEFFASGHGSLIEVLVAFSYTQKGTIEISNDIERNGRFSKSYDSKWISENLDYPTLLNNFIYLFDYVDHNFRSQLPLKNAEVSALERLLWNKGKKDYIVGHVYKTQSMLPLLEMKGYCQELEKNGRRLEDIFKWFFDTYLPEEFGAMGFVFNPPSAESTCLEKIKSLVTEIDSILKQFRMFTVDGEINRELFEISSEHAVFCTIPSMISEKYYYPNNSEIMTMMFYLFSDQSMLSCVERLGSKYETLYDILTNENVEFREFAEFQENGIKWLIEHGCLLLTDDNYVKIAKEKAKILKDLYINEVGCVTYIGCLKPTIMEMNRRNEIRFGSSLFSEPEWKYLNYVLNRSEFSDGLDLRNKYVHGTYPLNLNTQDNDYYTLMEILVTIVIKVNEEFCILNKKGNDEMCVL